MGGYYVATVTAQTTFTGTVLQVTAGAAPLEVIRAWAAQRNNATAEQLGVQIVRKTCTILGTSGELAPLEPNAAAAVGKMLYTMTSEGTTGTLLYEDGFNNLSGWLYLPVPEERIIVAPSSHLAMKLTVAPSTGTFSFGFVVREI